MYVRMYNMFMYIFVCTIRVRVPMVQYTATVCVCMYYIYMYLHARNIQQSVPMYMCAQVLEEIGVVPGADMTPEAALAKLSYLLTFPDLEEDKLKEVSVYPSVCPCFYLSTYLYACLLSVCLPVCCLSVACLLPVCCLSVACLLSVCCLSVCLSMYLPINCLLYTTHACWSLCQSAFVCVPLQMSF